MDSLCARVVEWFNMNALYFFAVMQIREDKKVQHKRQGVDKQTTGDRVGICTRAPLLTFTQIRSTRCDRRKMRRNVNGQRRRNSDVIRNTCTQRIEPQLLSPVKEPIN